MKAPQNIGAVVPAVLRQLKQQHGPLFAVRSRWSKLVGKQLAAHTKPVSLRRGQLVVHVDRPGDGFALSYQRTQLLRRLQATTKERIEELVIRPGEPKEA